LGKGIIRKHVLRRARPVTYVVHERHGLWQFPYGEDDHHGAADGVLICTGCAFDHFATEIRPADLPPGYEAERPKGAAEWILSP
jgi:hypothetical protein